MWPGNVSGAAADLKTNITGLSNILSPRLFNPSRAGRELCRDLIDRAAVCTSAHLIDIPCHPHRGCMWVIIGSALNPVSI